MNTTRFINLRQARVFDQLVSTTFSFVRYNAKPLAKILLVIAGPLILLVGFAFALYGAAMFGAITDTPAFSSGPSFLAIVSVVLLMATAVMAGVGTYTAVFSYISLYVQRNGKPIELNETWNATKSSLGIVISTILFIGFIAVLAYVFLILLIFILPSFLKFIAGFLFFCLAVYALIALSPLLFIRIHERLGMMDSVNRCFWLVKDYWWRTFGFLFVLYIVTTLISYALAIPLYAIGISTILLSDSTVPTMPSLLTIVIGIAFGALYLVGSYILSTIPLIGTAVQYFNLVERKEAHGLHERISGIEPTDNDTAQDSTL